MPDGGSQGTDSATLLPFQVNGYDRIPFFLFHPHHETIPGYPRVVNKMVNLLMAFESRLDNIDAVFPSVHIGTVNSRFPLSGSNPLSQIM